MPSHAAASFSSAAPLEGDRTAISSFLEGLPAMAAIVTVVAQPFAQDSLRASFDLEPWVPTLVAALASALLAIHRVVIVRASAPRECAVCIPLLMLMIFATYASGNNLVYYAKEGYTQAGASGSARAEEVASLKSERDLLQQQLGSAREMIDTLRASVGTPAAPEKPHAALRSFLRFALGMTVGEASAQERRPAPGSVVHPADHARTQQQLREKLQQYDARQQELNRKLEDVKRREEAPGPRRQPPLIKSW
jgi:hypothetical protein